MEKKRSGSKHKVNSYFKSRRWIKYLLYILLLTSVFTSATLAKYKDQASASATSMIAIFTPGIYTEDILIEESFVPGESIGWDFFVTNFDKETGQKSETKIEYSIAIESTKNLPLEYTITPKTVYEEDDNQTASSVEESHIAVGGKLPLALTEEMTHEYTLNISWPYEKNDNAYGGEIEWVAIGIDAIQVNPSG